MYRQGDILIQRIEEMPQDQPRIKRLILASGDSTAQRHQIKERGAAELFGNPNGDLYLRVTAEQATVIHPEHKPIALSQGVYRIWRQREFVTPQFARRVAD
jgi:hypothetical protein